MPQVFDVLIIGGGVAGLMSAQKLSGLGLRVALVERESTLASGPSTRNEGWLHRGTYHASSIRDRSTAIQVARRCIYGHKQLRNFAPEAVEDDGVKPLALVRDPHRAGEAVSRWDEAGVRYRRITHEEAGRIVPNATFGMTTDVFQVEDVSINTRVLYRKFFVSAAQFGCKFYLECKVNSIDGRFIEIQHSSGQRIKIEASKVVYASGAGTKKLYAKQHGVDLPMRYWKSHLIIAKRLSLAGVFYIDPKEAVIMHHGAYSVVGFNEDALQCIEPSYDVIPERAHCIENGIRRIFPEWRDNEILSIACVKVDYFDKIDDMRSLSVSISEPVDGHIVILPGKMSEAPYITDVLTSYIHQRIDNPKIALRPCDQFDQLSKGMSEG